MKFDRYKPAEPLQPYVRYLAISESSMASTYKVLPVTGLVLGFQYRGKLAHIRNGEPVPLAASGITGITDGVRVFSCSADIGTVLVYFTETGFAFFCSQPVHELFDQSIALEHLFDPADIRDTEERLTAADTDRGRIDIVERFLLAQLREIRTDRLVTEAVRRIYATGGQVRIKDLQEQLYISSSPFEKRFRNLVGTSPKKFATIVRFNAVLEQIERAGSLAELCYRHRFFDQAHFIKDFRKFAGDTPDQFRRSG